MGSVIIYKGAFQYDVVNAFADELARGFEESGRQVWLIDLRRNATVMGQLKDAAATRPELIVGFGAVGYQIRLGDQCLNDALDIPFWAFLVDHPAHHLSRLKPKKLIVSCIDRSHVNFLRRYAPVRVNAMFMPHGGCQAASGGTGTETGASNSNESRSPRNVDVLFPGTYLDPLQARQELAAIPQPYGKICQEAVAILLQRHSYPLARAIKAALGQHDKRPFNAETLKPYLPFLGLIDLAHRAEKRLRILRALDQGGVTVDIIGANWPNDLFKRHRVHAPRPFADILNAFRETKTVLNAVCFPDGSHERAYSAMLNGALPIVDSTPFASEPRNGDTVMYDWTALDALPKTLRAALRDKDALIARVDHNQTLAENNHRWVHRANAILNSLNNLNP